MNRVYRWAAIVLLTVPLVVDAWRVGNRWFDSWFVAQIKKAWRPRPETGQ